MSERAMMLRTFKRSRLWSVAVALLMAAQLGLALHSLEHKFDLAAPIGDDCALCQVASTMAPGASAEIVAAPTLHELIQVASASAAHLLIFPSPAGFWSRGPPVIVSL